MKKSVARRDDYVHSFFAASTERIAERLMEPGFTDGLKVFLAPRGRERRFTISVLLWLGIFGAARAGMRSMETILSAACAAVEGAACLPLQAVTMTESGWSRAKGRMSLGLLRRVWRRWVEHARAAAGEAAVYRGMHLVAFDKKTLQVPESLWTVFGSHRGCRGEGPAQAELMVAYDVCLRVPIEFTLGKVREDERVLGRRLLRKLPKALVLVDGGFYSIAFFADIRRAGHEFLTRMQGNGKPRLLQKLGPDDGLYEIRASVAYWKKKGVAVPETMMVRIVKVQWKGFRPVRIVTSLLDAEAFPCEELVDLYHHRWHIETFFRELTHVVEFEHWHTRTLKGLYVEMLFYMIYVSAVRAHLAEAAKAAGVLPGHLSFSRGAEFCVRAWCRMAKAPPDRAAQLRTELIEQLARTTIDIRPGRSFERDRQKRRLESRKKKLQALQEKKHAA